MTEAHYSISVAQDEQPIVAIKDFVIALNEITFLFGESGIGKSLLSKIVYGILEADDLDISVCDLSYASYCKEQWTEKIKRNSFFVFQEPSSHLNPLMTIAQQLREGSLRLSRDENNILKNLWRHDSTQTYKNFLHTYPKPYRPSGGEKQRLLLAMAFKKLSLLMHSSKENLPTFFVFDEPTGNLDNRYRNSFLSFLFEHYRKKNFTIFIITHDYSMISEIYKAHRDLTDRIHFKELRRNRNHAVTMIDFVPEAYTHWLNTQQEPVSNRQQEQSCVLRCGSSFSIFGKEYSICIDPRHQSPAELIISKGELVYLKAPSGVGKTTLAKVIMGLYPADRLQLTISSLDFTEKTPKTYWQKHIWGKKASMVFQHADEALNLNASVWDIFAGLPLAKKNKKSLVEKALSSLFDIPIDRSFLRKKTGFLSGGQKQRLNILRSLIINTDLLILDEPLNGLDFESIKRVMRLLAEKTHVGTAILVISHNEEIFDTLCHKTYHLTQMKSSPNQLKY